MAEDQNWGQQITKKLVQTYFSNWVQIGQGNNAQQAAQTLLQLYNDDTTSIFLEKPHQHKFTGGKNILQKIHCNLGKFQFDGKQLTLDMADVMGSNTKRLFHVQLVGKFQWDKQTQINIPNGWQNFSLSWITLVSKENNTVSAKLLGEIWKPVVEYTNFTPSIDNDDTSKFFGQLVTQFYQLWMKGDYQGIVQFYNQNSKCLHGDKSDTLTGQQNIGLKMKSYGKMAFDKTAFQQVKACSVNNNQVHYFLVNIVGFFQMGGQDNKMFFTQSWMVQVTGNQPVILNDFFKPVY